MPFLIDFDVVILHLLPSRTHPLLVRMLQDVFAVIRVNGVKDVEEVLSITVLAFRELIRHELHELRILAGFIPKV